MESLPYELAVLHYALGERDQALARLTQDEERKPKKQGEKIKGWRRYYLSRIETLRDHLRRCHGRPAPKLDGVEWLTSEPRPSGRKDSVGVLLLTHSVSERLDPIAQALQQFLKENRRRFLPVLIVNPRRNSTDAMKTLRKRARLTYAMGIDKTQEQQVFKRYRVAGGTALFVIDKTGRIAWCHRDVSVSDVHMARKVIQRLLDADP